VRYEFRHNAIKLQAFYTYEKKSTKNQLKINDL
jgi:hypothetical protein